jgi:diguanylate cyclase (GGDEF)-like protein
MLDSTTGAGQRQVLDAAMARALADRRAPGTALIMIDLDHFTGVNDAHGHPTGDAALRHAAAIHPGRNASR